MPDVIVIQRMRRRCLPSPLSSFTSDLSGKIPHLNTGEGFSLGEVQLTSGTANRFERRVQG